MPNLRVKSLSKKRDIHNFQQKLQRILNKIEVELSSLSATLLKNYHKALIIDGLSTATKEREMRFALRLSNMILKCKNCKREIKEWSQVTKEDIEDFIINLMQDYSLDGKDTEYTRDHKKTLKIFFRWRKYRYRSQEECILTHGVGDPVETRHVKKKNPDSTLRASDLITDEERGWLLEACDHPMDAFLIDVSLDGGLRAGENFNITIGDIKQDKYGFTIDVEGKTGVRPVRMINSTPSISKWMSSHPFKEDRNRSVLISLKKSNYGKPLQYAAAIKRIDRICEKVRKKHHGFTKKITLTLMRHTDSTHDAKIMSESLMKKRKGWSPKSNMPQRYSHLVNTDVDDAILEYHGIKIDEEKQKIPEKCPTCGMFNPFDARLCSKCGKPVSLEVALAQEEKENVDKSNLEKQFEDYKKDTDAKMARFEKMIDEKWQSNVKDPTAKK